MSLSPLHTIGDQVSEPLFLHHRVGHKEGMAQTEEMLRLVGFPNPARALKSYPFELSGGLRQRAMIAMALVCRPSLLIADEPTTALDVTIQAQILALVKDLQAELGMAVLIITHDLGVVANLAEEVVVLYEGRVMEQGPIHALYERPAHPYLKALLHAVPHFDMKPGERLVPVRPIEHDAGALVQKIEPWPADAPAIHLDVRGITKSFEQRGGGGLFGQRKGAAVPRRRRRELRHPARRVLRPRRRERLRQDHAVQGDHARARARQRAGAVQRPRHDGRRRSRRARGADAVPAARPVHLPGPVRLAEPADDGIRHPARAARDPRGRRRRLPGRHGEGADATRRARPAVPQPLSAQLFRRPAPAHRHRARARAEARSRALRRAGFRARRLDPGADPEPPQGPAGRARAHLPLHLAQSRGGRLHRRRDRRDVPRPHRRDRAARSPVQESAASLHARPPRGRAVRRPQAQARSGRGAGRRGPQPAGVARALHAGRRRARASWSTSATATACACRPGSQEQRLSA